MSEASPKPVNQLLAALPDAEYQGLVPNLEHVSLPFKQVLYEVGEPIKYVYFPDRAIVSSLTTMADGSMVEVALVGNDGVVGLPAALGDNIATTIAMVQVPDSAMRMKASVLKTEFQRGASLQSLLLRYMQALHAFVSQNAACNRLHYLEGRLARWLLLVCDRVESKELPMTHEFMSQMLGVRRAGVTEVANALQQAELIRYTRGKVTILNREELEAVSCECYQIIQGEYARLLGTKNG
ncbi:MULTISPECIES: Crp/Fnr family transcriptional regulator [unclassified Coleofasciculus]|uniref:Crp/Fnr family transcriptional regulator n=1 Tax=Cyanophyceae TaxID=3028117 RepID=UPI0016893A45|nr:MULTISPECIES: Crp/Fnr family transcriptional regulator [unclassified Coleofasciculus]MBD1880931.1 Crp/Fnr family transcriptional regulator [Coleofasciculus sp. FACHB-T130]MBD1897375.1 Crp/Fnr family transcriptional regulator [Coleofasciculus sp. FACHB-129]